MADEKKQEQKIVLKVDDYVKPLQVANQARQEFVQGVNKGFTESSKVFAQHMKQVKVWGASVKEDFEEFGKSFKANLVTGAQALTIGLGTDMIRNGAGAAMDMALEAGKKFAELKSRVAGSEAQFASWDKKIKETAVSSKTSLASLQDAFLDLSDSAAPDQIVKFMDQIGQATMLAHGNGRGVSAFVKSSLQGQGREFNEANVGDVLGGADVLRRKGLGFGSMEQAMAAMGGMNQNSLAVNKLNDRGLANILAGASRATGDSGRATSAVKELLDMSAKGQLQALSSQLGGSFKGKDGAFSLDVLGSARAQKATHLGKDDATSLEIFKQTSGLSADAAEATFRMIRNFESLNSATKDAAADQKALAASAAEAGDNLKDTLQQIGTKTIVGFEDILGGFQKPLNSLLGGHIGQAVSESQSAVAQAGAGVAAHPALVAGALAATAAGGALITGLATKVLGGASGGAPGAAGGLVSKIMGGKVQHVWVDNAEQIRSGVGMSPIGGGAAGVPGMPGGGAAGKAMGFMGKAVAVGAALEAGVAAGGAIDQFATDHGSTNQYGQQFNVFEKALAKVLPEALGGMTRQQYLDNYTEQRVQVEIISRDGRFDAVPKAQDNPRTGRTY